MPKKELYHSCRKKEKIKTKIIFKSLINMKTIIKSSSWIAFIFVATIGYAQLNVPIEVKETAGVGSNGHPITVVVPLKKGDYQDVNTFKIEDSGGSAVDAQFEVLNRWWGSDNSIRHIKVYFQPIVSAFTGSGSGITTYYLKDTGTGNSISTNLSVTEDASTITVNTGPLRFTVKKQNFNIIDEAHFDANGNSTFESSEQVINSSSDNGGIFTGRLAGDIQKDSDFSNTTVVIEEQGPMQVVIKANVPTIFNSTTDHQHGFAVRIYAYADKPFVKIDYQLQNSAKNVQFSWPLYFEHMGLDFDLNLGSTPNIRLGLGNGTTYSATPTNGVHLAQEDDDVFTVYDGTTSGGTVLSSGTQADGFIDINNGSLGITAISRYFWEMYPNGLTLDTNGDLKIDLYPDWASRWYVHDAYTGRLLEQSTSGLHWLDDMQHVVKEVVLNFHNGAATDSELINLSKTIDYHPVGVVPLSWYTQTKATLQGFGGDFPSTVAASNDNTRKPQWTANDYIKNNPDYNEDYKFGWANFGTKDPSRRKRSCNQAEWPSPGATFLITGNTTDYFNEVNDGMGELNHQPIWMSDYNAASDFGTVGLMDEPYCHGFWRNFPGWSSPNAIYEGTEPYFLAAPALSDTGRDHWARDDQHGWYQFVEESYYYDGNLWKKDWFEFVKEFRKPQLQGSTLDPNQRAMGHALMNAMQAYRVTGDLNLLDDIRSFRDIFWNRNGNDYSFMSNNTANPDSMGFATGYFLRSLIAYMEVVEDYDAQAWADSFRIVSALIEWNQTLGNFPIGWVPGDTGVSDGSGLTIVDPQAWYYWHTGKDKFYTHLQSFMSGGINGGIGPYGNFSNFSGTYENRFYQVLQDNLAQRQADVTPPAAVADLAATQNDGKITLTWTTPTDAQKFYFAWSNKPISEAYTTDTNLTNWWAATAIGTSLVAQSGTQQSITFTPPSSGNYYISMFTFDDTFSGMPNMSAMSNVANVNFTTTTWTGAVDNDWDTAGNWDTNSVPGASDDVVIPSWLSNYPTANSSVTVNSVTMNSGSSLIANATFSGNVTYNRTVNFVSGNTNGWYLMSAPVSGQVYNDSYVSANSIASNGANRAIASYTTSSDSWSYLQSGGSDTFNTGQGYSIKRGGLTGDVGFTGTLNTDNAGVSVVLESTGNRFNLLGNPYTSYIDSNTFLSNQAAISDTQTLWVWNQTLGTNGAFEVKLASDNFMIAPTQGFFVRSNIGGGTFTFDESNQSHNNVSDTFQRSTSNQTTIKLNLKSGHRKNYSRIIYNSNAATGFDIGQEGEMFTGLSNPFAVYSHLVSDNQGKKYLVQSLPNDDFENIVVPIGINGDMGMEITLSAEVSNLPVGINVYIEDKDHGTFTLLDNTSDFTTTLSSATNDIGRFYLHTKSSTLDADGVDLNKISMYTTDDKELNIVGVRGEHAEVEVYNILGQQLIKTSFIGNGLNQIPLTGFKRGLYIVRLITKQEEKNQKVIID